MSENRLTPEEITELKAAFSQLDPETLPAWAKAFFKFYVRMANGSEQLIDLLQTYSDNLDIAEAAIRKAIDYYEKETKEVASIADAAKVIQWLIDEREKLKKRPVPAREA